MDCKAYGEGCTGIIHCCGSLQCFWEDGYTIKEVRRTFVIKHLYIMRLYGGLGSETHDNLHEALLNLDIDYQGLKV